MVGRPKSKNFKRKTLQEEIKSILQQYPDDGQIFKEIIQNAEDAGASEVIFIHDKNDNRGMKRKLSYKELDVYQGPSLYTYNDGKFEEDDWAGISSLGISRKVKDPLKVGRFGLGFKSVFHLTDMPCVTSGSKLVYLDPLKSVFTETDCVAEYDFEDPVYESLLKDFDDFECFNQLGDKYWSNGSTNGSLFKFSLRQNPSEFSSVCYNEEIFEKLTEKFLNEAYLPLIFLKNIKSIKMYVIEKGSTDLEEIYSISLSTESQIHEKRRNFSRMVKQSVEEKIFDQILRLANEVHLVQNFKGTKQFSYVISEMFGYNGDNLHFKEMMLDDELSYVPLIAVALPIKGTEDVGGHIFSTLPLPLTKRRMTGMPVHVNGFFALGQDRKDLKWATLTDGDVSNDKSVNWNKCLLKELLPVVYTNLILEMVARDTSPDECYAAWPIQNEVDQKWHLFLKNFYEILFKSKVVYGEAKKAWITIENAVFIKPESFTDSQKFNDVKFFLEKCCEEIAVLPSQILSDLKQVNVITSQVACGWLKLYNHHYKDLSMEEKSAVLEFVNKWGDCINGLLNVPLFPLMKNGCLVSLSNTNQSSAYFFVFDEEQRKLLPTTEVLLDCGIFKGAEQFLVSLKKWIGQYKDGTNIKLIDCDETLIEAIKLSFPHTWKEDPLGMVRWPSPLVPQKWLESILHFAGQLGDQIIKLEQIPLVPVICNGTDYLWRISRENMPILKCSDDVEISPSILSLMSAIGVSVVFSEKIPKENIAQLCLNDYLYSPKPINVMKILERCYNKFVVFIKNYGEGSLREDLCEVFNHLPSNKIPNFVVYLPLFPVHNSGGTFVNVKDCELVEEDCIPSIWSPTMFPLVIKSTVLPGLVSKLKLKEKSFYELCFQLADFVQRLSFESKCTFSEFIMQKVKGHSEDLTTEFVERLALILHVKSDFGNFIRPSELFEKTDICQQIFYGETDRFPDEDYDVEVLRKFYLKDNGKVSLSDIRMSVQMINHKVKSGEWTPKNATRKVEGILKISITNDVNLLSLMNEMWIPIGYNKPSYYPEGMEWKGSIYDGSFLSPNSIYSNVDIGKLIGSVRCIVEPTLSDLFNQCFGTHARELQIEDVYQHLQNVQAFYNDEEKGKFKDMVFEIYRHFGSHLHQVLPLVQNHGMSVWQGHLFVPVNQIILTKFCINLEPYYFLVPPAVSSVLHNLLRRLNCEKNEFDLCLNTLSQIASKNDCRSEDDHVGDFKVSMQIVKYLAENESERCIEKRSEMFVPVEGEGLQLHPLSECYFIEQNRSSEFSSAATSNKVLHRELGKDIAEKLKIPSLISKVLRGQKSKFIKPWGQTESLTLRLRRLLEEYQDGLAIIKELVQNADDAGASEVKLLYDRRQNNEMKDFLIDHGMREWQGPCLWVYNNQIFTETDFENITKINAGSKEFDTKKIGKFGLGFNSVYHLTDVPSFLSNDSMVIFDPHAVYLGEALESKEVPGIRISLAGDLEELSSFKHQFEVFNGIFGARFDFRSKEPFELYKGTLFRLPLRKAELAEKSEIKNLEYSDGEVRKLLEKLRESLDHIILFTENVKSIEVWELRNNQLPDSSSKLFSVTKKCSNKSSIVDIANEELNKLKNNFSIQQKSVISQVVIQMFDGFENKEKCWLTSSTCGTTESFKFALDNKGHIPCGGVGIPIDYDKESGQVSMKKEAMIGKVFCFLPLPMQSELPIHVNGAFLISRNRKGLESHTTDEKSYCNQSINWNDLLGKDLGHAYLEILKYFGQCHKLLTLSDWVEVAIPKPTELHESFVLHLVESLVQKMIDSPSPIFPANSTWLPWSSLIVLEKDFPESIFQPAIEFMNWYYKLKNIKKECVHFPRQLFELFCSFGFDKTLLNSTIEANKVYSLFIENIHVEGLDDNVKTEMLDFILSLKLEGVLFEAMKSTACIPAKPKGRLRKPNELIKMDSKVSVLYTEDDEFFPMVNDRHFNYLQMLGMQSNTLPWVMVVERAGSIECLAKRFPDDALTRSSHLIELMDKIKSKPEAKTIQRLKKIKFLQVKQQPEERSFLKVWHATENDVLARPHDVYSENLLDVLSCSQLISQQSLAKNLEKELLNTTASHTDIVKQINEVLHAYERKDGMVTEEMEVVLRTIYRHIHLLSSFYLPSHLTFVLTNNMKLAKPNQVFQQIKAEIPGFLYQINNNLSKTEYDVLETLGVRKECNVQNYIDGLISVKGYYGEKEVSTDVLDHIVHKVIPYIYNHHPKPNQMNIPSSTFCSRTLVPNHVNIPYLPAENRVMYNSKDLCYKDDCQGWLPSDPNVKFLHEEIPRVYAQMFNVKSLREDMLQRHPEAEDLWCEFGQKENLTTRIKNLLRGYSEPEDIFKEMLQNADDAGATEIEFILDKRNHQTEKIFSEKWKLLQGPALLVRNNGKFSTNDLRGIQNLGVGSKREDPLTTGKYGVGFNAVYGITDCPMLLTPIQDFDDVLCIFDPNLLYVEGASEQRPGRMLKNARKFLEPYVDVKSSFLIDEVDTENHTLFRFPFRSKEMAMKSKISKHPTKVGAFGALLSRMQKRANDILLFLNNISKIGFTIINESDRIDSDYFLCKSSIQHTREHEELQKFQRNFLDVNPSFEDLVGEFRRLQRKACVQHYKSDKIVRSYHWDVVEQCGFSDIVIDSNFQYRLGNQKLRLVPKGGIAKLSNLKECECCADLVDGKRDWKNQPSEKGLFCTLPLPITDTGFPALINGNFILDYETRRGLKLTDQSSLEVLWNNYLLKGCVLPCYLQYMLHSVDVIKGRHNKNKWEMKTLVDKFYGNFPLSDNCKDEYWKRLCSDFYQTVYKKDLAILIFRKGDEIIPCRPNNDFLVYHCDQQESISRNLYSNTSISKANEKMSLLEVLKAVHVHVDEILLKIENDFKKFHCPLIEMSPSIIRERLATCCVTTQSPLLNSPLPISETAFEKVDNLLTLLKYCLSDTSKNEVDLDGLPLCLLADKTLVKFSKCNPKFFTRFTEFFPTKSSLFIHLKVYKIIQPAKQVNRNCTRKFHLPEFCGLLNQCIPSTNLKGQNQPVLLEDINEVSMDWIYQFWYFVFSLNGNNTELVVDLSPVEDWCFVLALRNEITYLLPVRQRKHVLHLTDSTSYLNSILIRYGIYQPPKDMYKKENVFGCADNADDLINALYLAKSDAPCTSKEGDAILHHLQWRAKSITQMPKLKRLPLFETHIGAMTPLGDMNTVLLPPEIPINDISILTDCNKCLFLCSKDGIRRLYDYLGVDCTDWVKFYNHYFLPFSEKINNEAMKEHLKFLHVQIQREGFKSSKVHPILYQLRIKRLFPSRSGEKRLCSEMYNPNVEIFIAMLSDDNFPAIEFCGFDWLPFLIKIGLVEKLTTDLLVKFCQELQDTTDMEKVTKVSPMLCSKLGVMGEGLHFLKRVSGIKFMIPAVVNKNCTTIHSSLNSTADRICFNDSCLYYTEYFVWTNKYILPSHTTIDLSKPQMQSLGIDLNPNEAILKNLQNILKENSIKSSLKFQQKTTSYLEVKDEFRGAYKMVLTKYYEKMSTSPDLLSLIRGKNISFMLVNNCNGLDIPKRSILQDEKKAIPPYLNNVPVYFGGYFEVFETLGCSKKVESCHMFDVLDQLHHVTKGQILSPKELKEAMVAVSNLSGVLETSSAARENLQENQILYLPTYTFTNCANKYLHPSHQSLFVDDFHLEKRLREFDEPLVLDTYTDDIDPHKIINKNLMMYLPDKFKPRKVSDCIREVLKDSETDYHVGSQHISHEIQKRLKNPIFIESIERLFFHEGIEVENLLQCLNNVKVHVKRRIETVLYYKKITMVIEPIEKHLSTNLHDDSLFEEEVIPKSEETKKIFFKLDDQFRQKNLDIFFGLEASEDQSLYSEVTENLLAVLGNKLEEPGSILSLSLLLSEPIVKLPQLLDDKGISRGKGKGVGTIPLPGEPVPIELHDILRPDFSNFEIGEYVAVETDGGKVYYYAIFKRHDYNPVATERLFGLQTTDDDDNVEDVPAYLVYKFERNFSEESCSDFFMNFEGKEYDEITKELRRIFKNLIGKDTIIRRKVLRRLYLTWHPDKHPEETKDHATKVFQFIQEQIMKLDDKDIDTSSWADSAQKSWKGYRNYASNFRYPHSNSTFWSPPTFRSLNPQPEEARRWWRQAHYDVTAATYQTYSNEWICYMAHQGAEKALKAFIFKDDYQRMNTHCLYVIACNTNSKLQDLARELENVTGYAERMRYPDRWTMPGIPHTGYTDVQASRARELAKEIVDIVKQVLF